MAKLKKKFIEASFSIPEPSNFQLEPPRITADNFEQELDEALEAGDYTRALEVLDAAPRWMKKQPEIALIRATVILGLGQDREALHIFRDLERKNPRFAPLYLPLTFFYMEQECPAHALQAAKRARSDRDITEEAATSLNETVEEATAYIQNSAEELGISFETMQRACIFHEQALLAILENNLPGVDHFSREAIKIAPNWNPPHNN
ncbi:MAG: hypothetical protein IH586_13150, partial [Anaerolineaceae bacterium]|nr:hypothetical protein [Anaerolineaceae bacterium]